MTAPTIPSINDLPSMVQAIDRYVHGALPSTVPGAVADAVTKYFVSPVDKVVTVAEALYAAAQMNCLDEAGMILAVQATNFCMMNSWHAIGQTARGTGVIQALRRQLGDDTVTQTPAQDPAPNGVYMPTPPGPGPGSH